MPLPVIAGIALAGSVIGTGMQVLGASKAAEANKQIAQLEMQQAEQQKKAMELDARRRQLQQIRQAQQARSMALTAATAQGATQSSGLEGAYGQISGGVGTNLLGINQNLEIGRTLFGLSSQIDQQKMSLADAQSLSAFGSGLTSLGGSVMTNLGAINRLQTTGFGGIGYNLSNNFSFKPGTLY